MTRLVDYIYIFLTIGLTVYGQIMLKFQIEKFGSLPQSFFEKIKFLLSLFLDFGILSCFIAAFLASLAWMAAMTKFDLSHAYPFMSLNFVVVLILCGWLFGESLSSQKILGVSFIVIGTIVAARG
jgi:multidrug transporter EmrE-like cation transporter